jgi:hypothetical protein
LSVVARPGRKFAVAHGPELPAERLLGDRDAEFLEDPLRQIDQPPAYHAMYRWDRTTLDHAGDGLALGIIELGWMPRRLAIQQTVRPSCVEAQNPIPDNLKADPADFGRLGAGRAIINRSECQKSASLRPAFALPSQTTKL